MISAIPSSMCWPCSFSRQRTSVSESSANQSMRSPACQTPTRLIQPPRLVDEATSGLTVTTRFAISGAPWARSTKKRPKACWVEAVPACSCPSSAGTSSVGTGVTAGRSSRAAARRQSSLLGAAVREGRPRIVGVGAEVGGEVAPLLVAEERRVVAGMALGRQAPGLDRVGEDHRRAVDHLVGGGERVEQHRQVVAAEVAEREQQLVVVEVRDRVRDGPPAGAVPGQALAQHRRRRAEQPLILLVRHRLDPVAERRAAVAREELLEPAAPLGVDRVPAGRLEHPGDAACRDVRHDPVE